MKFYFDQLKYLHKITTNNRINMIKTFDRKNIKNHFYEYIKFNK